MLSLEPEVHIFKHIGFAAVIACVSFPALAAEVAIAPDIRKFDFTAGEAQSTVVPPAMKGQCKAGRILVTNDLQRPSTNPGESTNGIVHWRDLDSNSEGVSVHDTPPNASDYFYGSNDHRIVTLNNADVVYSIAAFSKRSLKPEPGWFHSTFRTWIFGDKTFSTFGPGARSVMLTWRSTDCGQSFKWISEIDSATLSHGQCGDPQPYTADTTPIAGQKFDMGGTDGPWLGVDPVSGMLIMTHGCFGNLPADPNGPWKLGPRVDRTVVLGSIDGGSTWSEMGQTPPTLWGSTAVMQPAPAPLLAVGVSTGIVIGRTTGPMRWAFPQAVSVSGATWGWPSGHNLPSDLVSANIWASTIITRVPGSRAFLLAFPAEQIKNVGGKSFSYGYRLFLYDPTRANPTFEELPPITPTAAGDAPSGDRAATMHLTAIDPGEGPVLLYWYDLDGFHKKASIRGRVLFGFGQISNDIDIRRAKGAPTPFDLVAGTTAYWYGDYQSAGGFGPVHLPGGIIGPKTYRYFPMWIEPDHTVRYAEVNVSIPTLGLPASLHLLTQVKTIVGAQLSLSREELRLRELHEHTRGVPSRSPNLPRRHLSPNAPRVPSSPPSAGGGEQEPGKP